MVKAVFLNFVEWLRDGLFPVFCLGCRKDGAWLCEDCLVNVPWAVHEARVVGELKEVWSLFSYARPEIKGLIRHLKFTFSEELRRPMERLLDRGVAKYGTLWPRGEVVVCGIPTTEARLRERGFDHVRWMAEYLASVVGGGWWHEAVLVLAREHRRQSHCRSDEERRANIQGAFRVAGDVAGRRVILIDDVFTTGATLQEAARALRAAGASEVFGITLAGRR